VLQDPTNAGLLKISRRLFDSEEIDTAISKIAEQISKELTGESVIALCVMNGAIPFFSQLILKLPMTLEVDYVHASRYNNSVSGGDLRWIAKPSVSLEGKTVIIIDDILDEGITLREIGRYCLEAGAKQVKTAILLEKQHSRNLTGIKANYLGLTVSDEYVFGFGMDCEGIGRNLHSIHALVK